MRTKARFLPSTGSMALGAQAAPWGINTLVSAHSWPFTTKGPTSSAAIAANLEEINNKLDQLLNEVRSLRQAERPVPDERKYSKKEAGVRIAFGQDPARIPAEKRKAMQEDAYSESWVYRRLADDDSGLEKTMVAGKCRITEKAIRLYERQL